MPRTRDTDLLRTIGTRLQQLRQQRMLTQEALAERLKVDITTLSKWETGVRAMSLSALATVADVLGVPLADIVGVDREMPKTNEVPEAVEAARILQTMEPERRALALRVLRELARR